MGINHDSIDWNVGAAPVKSSGANKSSGPVGAYDPNRKPPPVPPRKPQKMPVENEKVPPPRPTTPKPVRKAKIKSAVLVPDDKTDFNKPCKFKVDVELLEGKGAPVQVALWGKYRGKEYDLKSTAIAELKGTTAEGQVSLFYVDPHYKDAVRDKKTGLTVDYFLKVQMTGAGAFTGATLTMPVSKGPITVTPKANLEYKVILLDRKLSQHQDGSEKKITVSPSYLEIYLEQNSTAKIFDKGAVITTTGAGKVDFYEDKECTKKVDATKPVDNAKITDSKKIKLWLLGTQAGKCTIEVKAQASSDAFKLGDPVKLEIGILELKLNAFIQDTATIKTIQIDPDQTPVTNYYKALKEKVLPEQIVLSDADKVAKGRVLHVQKNGNFSRARLVLAKIDTAQLPSGIDDYEVVINGTKTNGTTELHTKENEDAIAAFPVKIKISELGKGDKTYWIQGKTASKAIRDAVVDIGIDRKVQGPVKEEKRYGDWARFTIVEIKEVKVDYTAPAGKASAWDTTSKKFFINVQADPAGRAVTIGAKLSEPIQDITIHLMLIPHKDNGKKANWGVDLPSTWKWETIDVALKHKDKNDRKDLLHLSNKTDNTGYTKVDMSLSRFAGDIFTPAAYIDQDPHLAKYIEVYPDLVKKKPVISTTSIKVWRKFWYQISKAKGIDPPKPDNAVNAYNEVRAEMAFDEKKEFDDTNTPAQTFYEEYMFEGGSSTDKVANIGDYNKNTIAANFISIKADQPVKRHLLICSYQYDTKVRGMFTYATGYSSAIRSAKPADTVIRFKLDKIVINPPLQGGSMIKELYWYRNSTPGTRNNIDPGKAFIPNPRASNREIAVKLPAIDPAPSFFNPVYVVATCYSPVGPYLGESFDNHTLIVYDPDDVTDYNDTVVHEIGHSFNQTPRRGKQSDKDHIPDHPNQKDRGQGNHCQESDWIFRPICVMYDSGPMTNNTALHKYCKQCHPYLIVEDLYKT